ncbi:MAG: LacI family DNA-binding transcriptional regulator [Spirochaetales bacterium]|nr:LacI family DNA-binding transcriptional regulator [Spirochaetales bacterium]
MKRPRLLDVAERAGVSLSTASLALAGKGRISPGVREQVLAAAQELGYRKIDRSFPRRPSGLRYVAILHHEDKEYEWGFIRPILLQIESCLHHHGFFPVLLPVRADSDPEAVFRRITEAGAGAVFSIHFHDEGLFDRLEKRGTLVIVVNNSNLQDKFDSVCVDDFQGAYEGALYLIKLGHRSIAYLEYERPELPAVVADRFVGFKKALDENGIPLPPEHRITVPSPEAAHVQRMLPPLFGRPDRPTALFAHDDYVAVLAVEALAKLDLRVPEDVSLIAPGDILDYGQWYVPPITTMRINTTSLGKLACNLFFDRLRNNIEDIHVLKLKQQLVRRGTCSRLR